MQKELVRWSISWSWLIVIQTKEQIKLLQQFISNRNSFCTKFNQYRRLKFVSCPLLLYISSLIWIWASSFTFWSSAKNDNFYLKVDFLLSVNSRQVITQFFEIPWVLRHFRIHILNGSRYQGQVVNFTSWNQISTFKGYQGIWRGTRLGPHWGYSVQTLWGTWGYVQVFKSKYISVAKITMLREISYEHYVIKKILTHFLCTTYKSILLDNLLCLNTCLRKLWRAKQHIKITKVIT